MKRAGWTLTGSVALALLAGVNAATIETIETNGPNTPARLERISSRVEAGHVSVLIEASEPVAYVATRPDPLTVLVDLRDVTTAGLINRLATAAPAPVADVAIEQATAADGSALARVTLSLVAPAAHHVRSSRGVIRVDFDRPPTARIAGRTRVTAAPAPAADADRAALAAGADRRPAPGGATRLRSVRTETGPQGVIVTLTGNGALTPGRIAEVAASPPRLFLDFPGVSPGVPDSTRVDLGPIRRIRVGLNRRRPIVTRVVFDLTRPVRYHVAQSTPRTDDLTITFEADGVAAPDPIDALTEQAPDPPRDPANEASPAATAASPGAPAEERAPGAGTVSPVTSRSEVMRSTTGSQPVSPPLAPGRVTPVKLVDLPVVGAGARAPRASPAARLILPSQPVPDPDPDPDPESDPGQEPAAAGTLQVRPAGQASQFTGEPVTLDFQNADLRAVLRTFAEISSLNIVIDPSVQGSVDVSLRDVPWDQAFDVILRANKLGYSVNNTVIRIAPLTVLADEEAQRRKLAEEQALSGALRVMPRTLSYARAADLADLLTQSVLSARGQVQIDERTNTLIITDLPEKVDAASELIGTLDRAEPQVEIEARVVQTTSDFARAIGVQWGLNGRIAPDLGNTTSLGFPNRGSLTGRAGPIPGPAGIDSRVLDSENSGTVVNLPVLNPTGAIGLTLGSVNGSFNLDVALSALENSGKGRILSTPRVTTQNNVEAEMKQGIQIPIQTVANNTVTVEFKDALLSLRVTPQITAANTVIMHIILENAAADFSMQVNGIPPINTQYASTQVQVDDGATTVIGGIFTTNELSQSSRVPFLHRIPLLGWLFRRESVQKEDRELLIFLTPRIIR